MSPPPHVAEAVEAEMVRKYPPGVRLLLDLVRAGDCGQHSPNEHAARAAQVTGEWNPDRASSDAFLDLAWALKNLSPEHESGELCARALAEAWRREYPFRRGRDGDPLDVLLPHQDDAGAARALDRARVLPRPPVGLMRLATNIEDPMLVAHLPFDRPLALALIAEADRALAELPAEVHDLDLRRTAQKAGVLRRALMVAERWACGRPVQYDAYLDMHKGSAGDAWSLWFSFENGLRDAAQAGEWDEWDSHTITRYLDASQVVRVALLYVSAYNTQLRELAEARRRLEGVREEWGLANAPTEEIEAKIREYEAHFPDGVV